tara:strand:- start:553 stop:753 length:201 start_codon:yes stop_codon:yes gene_type:complete
MKVICEFCGGELESTGSAMKQVIAWVEPGKNAAKLQTDGAGWAHKFCVLTESKRRRGQFEQTESLF